MNRILALRKAKRLSQQKLAALIHVHQTAISQWETGRTRPDMYAAQALADYFKVSIDCLLGRTPDEPSGGEALHIPVLGVIPAGIPVEAVEDILDYEEIPSEWAAGGKEYFALRIRGNSMFPKYLENDTVIFQKAESCDSGAECAVFVGDNDATFKKVIRQGGGVVLQPLNTADFDPEFYSKHEVGHLPIRILGVAKEIRRRI